MQRRLKEKGIDCRIDFFPVSTLLQDEYTEWLAQQKEENEVWEVEAVSCQLNSAFNDTRTQPLLLHYDKRLGQIILGGLLHIFVVMAGMMKA